MTLDGHHRDRTADADRADRNCPGRHVELDIVPGRNVDVARCRRYRRAAKNCGGGPAPGGRARRGVDLARGRVGRDRTVCGGGRFASERREFLVGAAGNRRRDVDCMARLRLGCAVGKLDVTRIGVVGNDVVGLAVGKPAYCGAVALIGDRVPSVESAARADVNRVVGTIDLGRRVEAHTGFVAFSHLRVAVGAVAAPAHGVGQTGHARIRCRLLVVLVIVVRRLRRQCVGRAAAVGVAVV